MAKWCIATAMGVFGMSTTRKGAYFFRGVLLISTFAYIFSVLNVKAATTISEELYKRLKRGYDQVQKGSYDKAVKTFCEAVRRDRDSITARRYLAYALVKSGAGDQAMDQLSFITKMTTPTAFDLYLYGEAYFTQGNYKESLTAFEKCLAAVPNCDAARGGVIKSLTLQGEYNQATTECISGLNTASDETAKKYYQAMLNKVKEIAVAPPAPQMSSPTTAVHNQLDLGLESVETITLP